MTVVKVENKKKLLHFFDKDRFLHLYEIGDLDEFFWPNTEWYGLKQDNVLQAVLLIYRGSELPVLLALENINSDTAKELLLTVIPELPGKFYCHLSPALKSALAEVYTLDSHGMHDKMHLTSSTYLDFLTSHELRVRQLDNCDREMIHKFYQGSYPENWFDERMLLTGKYFGGFLDKRLVSISGIHVYSKQFGVAALGNITTAPEYRGRGYAKIVTAHLCNELAKDTRFVGLNVKSDNLPAIEAYKQLGFEFHSSYEEFMAKKNED